ncbi:alpha/beta fold hydrolase [Isoptericola sp. NPDC058082]|uniref:alpha/beta fold hydrolase n=1 Tax=Isoptericola sp. NPDC058082 TaxID=3346331 RepID=UPI0036E659FF
MTSELTIHTAGDAASPTVVVLHGLTDAGDNFPDLVHRWQQDWRIVAPSMRGHGTSPRFRDDELGGTAELMLADVLAVLDDQPEPVVLLGHSMGGALALRAAVARPAAVRALVLEDPPRADGGASPAEHAAGFLAFVEGVSARVAHGELDALVTESAWSPPEARAWARCKPQVQRDYLRRGLHLGRESWADLVSRLTVPTLLVLPDRDSVGPAPDEPGPTNPLLRTVVVADAGHCVRRDQPDAYFEAVEGFLASALS